MVTRRLIGSFSRIRSGVLAKRAREIGDLRRSQASLLPKVRKVEQRLLRVTADLRKTANTAESEHVAAQEVVRRGSIIKKDVSRNKVRRRVSDRHLALQGKFDRVSQQRLDLLLRIKQMDGRIHDLMRATAPSVSGRRLPKNTAFLD